MSRYSYDQKLIYMNGRVEQLSKILKVLGDTNRLGILISIGKDSLSVTEIINATGLSQTLVSFHLRALRAAGIVSTKRDGSFIYYSLTDNALMDILKSLSDIRSLKTEEDELARSRELVNQRR